MEKINLKKSSKLNKYWLFIIIVFMILICGITSIIFYNKKKINSINDYSNSAVNHFLSNLPDFSYAESNYRNKTLTLYFKENFEYLTTKEQYSTLDLARKKYLSFLQRKGYWKKVKPTDLSVVAQYPTSLDDIADLTDNVMHNDRDEQFNGQHVKDQDEKLPIKHLQNLDPSPKPYDDDICKLSAREHSLFWDLCVKRVIEDDCDQFMGKYMRDGQFVNSGKKEDTLALKTCINEHISPENRNTSPY